MRGFHYISSMREFYSPRTPRAALMAAEANILPIEAFAYKAASVKPLFEEPYDLDDLEQFLAQPNLDFAGAMMLSEIFVAMTRAGDKERALFAAESLTSLEDRWARKVDEARRHAAGERAERSFLLGRSLYERALVAGRTAAIRDHYLREALHFLDEVFGSGTAGPAFALLIRCLVRLGELDEAEARLAPGLGRGDDGEVLALAVEIAYLRKDVHRIAELLHGKDLDGLALDEGVRGILSFWQA
ncbi:MAG TPA: hypothetical protein VMV44_10570 [Rectinemataceae bacterium]|nr:hypothetical protein [Rectinemataceae bacterium]